MSVGKVQLNSVPPVSTPQTPNQLSFCGKKIGETEVKEYPDHFEKRTVVEGTSGKKWGVGLASAVIPGLGQFINGDILKGLAFLVTSYGALVGAKCAALCGKLGGALGGVAVAGVTGIWAIVDAVKNAKSTVVTIENKK